MSSDSEVPNHPAKYSVEVLEEIRDLVPSGVTIFDPFGGVGWPLATCLSDCVVIANEIEPEWAAAHPCVRQGNALDLPEPDGYYGWAVTSPVYGNRMSDSHNAQERCKACRGEGLVEDSEGGSTPCGKCEGKGRRKYRRLTYTHQLGRKLHADNAGQLQWGGRYREFHAKAWLELRRVLKHGGFFILNISDHIRGGTRMPVTAWHDATLTSMGFIRVEEKRVQTKRMGYGQHADKRVDYESVILYQLDKSAAPPRIQSLLDQKTAHQQTQPDTRLEGAKIQHVYRIHTPHGE